MIFYFFLLFSNYLLNSNLFVSDRRIHEQRRKQVFVGSVEVDDQLEVREFRSHDIGLVRGAGARTYFTLPYRDPCYHGQIRVPRARNSAQVTDYKPSVCSLQFSSGCNFDCTDLVHVYDLSWVNIFFFLITSERRKRKEENLLRIRKSKKRESSEGKVDFIYDGNKYSIGKNFSGILSAMTVVSETIASGIWDYYIFCFFWPPFWPMQISSFLFMVFLR